MIIADVESLVFRGQVSSPLQPWPTAAAAVATSDGLQVHRGQAASAEAAEEELVLMDDDDAGGGGGGSGADDSSGGGDSGADGQMGSQIADLLSIIGENESREEVLVPLVYSLGQQISDQLSKQTKRNVLIVLEIIEPLALSLKTAGDFDLALSCNEDGYLVAAAGGDAVGGGGQQLLAAFEWAKLSLRGGSARPEPTGSEPKAKPSLPSRLRSLPSKYFLCVLRYACGAASRLLRRLGDLQRYATKDLGRQNTAASWEPAAAVAQSKQWSECLQRSNEKANECIARLVTFRSTQVARTTRAELGRLICTCNHFIELNEKLVVCHRPCVSLRSVVAQQAKAWVEHFHSTQLEKLSMMLEMEKWTAALVAPELQHMFSNFTASVLSGSFASGGAEQGGAAQSTAVVQVVRGSNGRFVSAEASEQGLVPMGNSGGTPEQANTQPSSPRTYKVIPTMLMLFNMIHSYLGVLSDFEVEGLAAEITHRMVALLRQFNLKTSQLVLGAGAMVTASLKSITAKHLALASQSVELVAIHIPVIRRILVSKLKMRQRMLAAELEQVEEDYWKHADQVQNVLCKTNGARPMPAVVSNPRCIIELRDSWRIVGLCVLQVTAKLLDLAELVCSTACQRGRPAEVEPLCTEAFERGWKGGVGGGVEKEEEGADDGGQEGERRRGDGERGE